MWLIVFFSLCVQVDTPAALLWSHVPQPSRGRWAKTTVIVYNVTITLIGNLSLHLIKFNPATFSLILCSIFLYLTCLLFPVESADEDIPDAMFKESCITEQTQYFFDNDERSYSGVLDCGNCSRCVGVASCVSLRVCMCVYKSVLPVHLYCKWVCFIKEFPPLLCLLPEHPSV